jgi:hypothetical protein
MEDMFPTAVRMQTIVACADVPVQMQARAFRAWLGDTTATLGRPRHLRASCAVWVSIRRAQAKVAVSTAPLACTREALGSKYVHSAKRDKRLRRVRLDVSL